MQYLNFTLIILVFKFLTFYLWSVSNQKFFLQTRPSTCPISSVSSMAISMAIRKSHRQVFDCK